MIWELETGFEKLIQTLTKIPIEEAQWKATLYTRTLDTIKKWNQKGDKWINSQNLDPISTIEYKTIHLAQCKQMYDNYAFGNKKLNWNELECPEWPLAIEYLKQTQIKLVESLQNLSDIQLNKLVYTNWGDLWPVKQILSTMIHHDAYHFGQICTIRNLYKIQKF